MLSSVLIPFIKLELLEENSILTWSLADLTKIWLHIKGDQVNFTQREKESLYVL